jgi:hypothetical protein
VAQVVQQAPLAGLGRQPDRQRRVEEAVLVHEGEHARPGVDVLDFFHYFFTEHMAKILEVLTKIQQLMLAHHKIAIFLSGKNLLYIFWPQKWSKMVRITKT